VHPIGATTIKRPAKTYHQPLAASVPASPGGSTIPGYAIHATPPVWSICHLLREQPPGKPFPKPCNSMSRARGCRKPLEARRRAGYDPGGARISELAELSRRESEGAVLVADSRIPLTDPRADAGLEAAVPGT